MSDMLSGAVVDGDACGSARSRRTWCGRALFVEALSLAYGGEDATAATGRLRSLAGQDPGRLLLALDHCRGLLAVAPGDVGFKAAGRLLTRALHPAGTADRPGLRPGGGQAGTRRPADGGGSARWAGAAAPVPAHRLWWCRPPATLAGYRPVVERG